MKRLAFVSVALILIGSACGGSKPAAKSSTSPSPSPSGTETGDLVFLDVDPYRARYGGTTDVSGNATLAMDVDRYMGLAKPMFVPTIVIGSPGQKLTITITNKTPGAHNFTVPVQHIDRNIAVGAKETVVVTFPTKGALVFYCSIHYIAEQLFQAGEFLVKA